MVATLERLGVLPRNWSPITEVLLNPKKHNNEIQEEFTIDTTPPMPRSKVSAVSEAVEQFSDIRGGCPEKRPPQMPYNER